MFDVYWLSATITHWKLDILSVFWWPRGYFWKICLEKQSTSSQCQMKSRNELQHTFWGFQCLTCDFPSSSLINTTKFDDNLWIKVQRFIEKNHFSVNVTWSLQNICPEHSIKWTLAIKSIGHNKHSSALCWLLANIRAPVPQPLCALKNPTFWQFLVYSVEKNHSNKYWK